MPQLMIRILKLAMERLYWPPFSPPSQPRYIHTVSSHLAILSLGRFP